MPNIEDDAIIDNDSPVVPAPAPAPVAIGEDDDPEFASMTPRERAMVTKARGQEKKKLYKRLENYDELVRQVSDLQTQLRDVKATPVAPTPAAEEKKDDKIEKLTQLILDTQKQITDMNLAEIKRRRDAELRTYMSQRIQEMRDAGEELVVSLVGGSSEEEIDNSINIARADYLLIESDILARQERNGRRGTPPAVTVQQSRRRPADVPPIVTPNSVEADPEDEIINQIVADPNEAVRSGAYNKTNRNQILRRLKGFKYVGNNPA